VRCASGARHEARRAVLADVSAPALYGELLDPWMLPARAGRLLRRFQWDSGTVKVDWALRAPIPWSAQDARHAGTVHVTGGLDELTRVSADLASGRVPDPPFLILGQYAPVDPTRMPPGTDAVWAYTHVPNPLAHPGHAPWDAERLEALAVRMEAEIERRAPGFGGLVAGRSIAGPAELQAADANLGGGALNAGTAQLHQQLVFRPAPGLMGPRTPVDGLWLAGASAHPGGGVHGACGANAARAALREATAAGRARALARSGSRRLRRG
jgi:phytoene dehydrogenase-like protein